MNLDLSPDGKTIAFDLLGDIYTIPVSGGKATPLRTGLPFEVQPRFSPDGKQICFTSDAGGGDNIWVMDVNGNNAKQITKESFRLLNNAVWTPDGNYIIARKHFTSGRSLGAGEMWMYHVAGSSGIQLTKRKNSQQDVNEPSLSADGKYLYFSEDMYPGGYFQYNKDPNNEIFVVKRYDRETGDIKVIAGGPGSASRPQISRDGKTLAYVHRVRTLSVLCLLDLETGAVKTLYDKLDKDQMEAWTVFGTYPNFSWTPDNKSIIIWAGGKIHKLEVASGKDEIIPFEVSADIRVQDALHFKNSAFDPSFQSKMIKNALTSPDGKTLYFCSIGAIWKKDLPNGTPTRINPANPMEFESEPSISADGKKLIYVTWNDETQGAVKIIDLASKSIQTLSTGKGIFREPKFSPDGKAVIYRKEEGNGDLGYLNSNHPGIYYLELKAGAQPKLVTEEGFEIAFKSNDRIYFQSYGDGGKVFKSIGIDGKKEKTHFSSEYTNSFVASPDGKWVAFRELYKVYVAEIPASGAVLDLNGETRQMPVSCIGENAGINIHWSADSKKVYWTLGNRYFNAELEKRFTYLGKTDSVIPVDTNGIAINLQLQADVPKGLVALTGGKIITMKGDEVIENGVILVDGNIIKAVGKVGEVTIPQDAKVLDCKGMSLMPGIVDVHAHVGHFGDNLLPQKHWPYYANLAYGVTTTHDPSTNTEKVFTLAEMVRTGTIVGPRVFSTGTILYGADGDFKAVINSLDDAYFHIKRTSAFGAFSVKSYNQPRREQRQQVITAARNLNIQVVPEGGSFFYHNMSMIMDGHTGIEHNVPVHRLYSDVTTMWGRSKTFYTPTLIVAYGALNGENYWYQKTNVWEESRLLKYTPRTVIDTRARHRTMAPDEEYQNGHILVSQHCKALTDAGVKVNLGAHGQLQGLGAHWELWMLAHGGMTNLQAIRCATLNGAEYLGMEKQIGSLEVGKLADIAVVSGDLMADIRLSKNVRYVMINGRLYDTETMNEVLTGTRKRTQFYWENPACNGSGPLHDETNSGCGCRH